MTIFAVGSAQGAPGGTTVAMALGALWPQLEGRRRMVIEADPNGGVLVGRFDGLRADRTVVDAAMAVQRARPDGTPGDVSARLVELARPVWEGVEVIPAPPSAEQVVGLLRSYAEPFAAALASAGDLDAIVDVGRLSSWSPVLPLVKRSVVTLLVSRTRFEDVALLVSRCRELASVGVSPRLVCIGARPYPPEEVAAAAGVELVAALPEDLTAAAAFTSGIVDRRARRSPLWRALTELASNLPSFAAPPVFTPAANGQAHSVAS